MNNEMNDFYENLIYSNNEEKEKIRKSFEDDIKKNRSDQITENWPLDVLVFYDVMQYESKKLFDIATDKFGKSLWESKAWRLQNCEDECPFGACTRIYKHKTGCDKKLFEFDGQKYCYGQIYINLPNLNQEKKTELLKNLIMFISCDFLMSSWLYKKMKGKKEKPI